MIVEKTMYTDTSVEILISDIIEYDIKSAGLTMIRKFKLLPDDKIKELEAIKDKAALNKTIGNLEIKNKALVEAKNEKFKDYRIRFYIDNELEDDDILSIKKDALFVKKYCYELEFDGDVQFVEKNKYFAYMYLNHLELYFKDDSDMNTRKRIVKISKPKDLVHVKGIKDDKLEYHRDYMIKFLHTFMKMYAEADIDVTRRYLVKFINQYKKRLLEPGYYREFNQLSNYKVLMDGKLLELEYTDEVYNCDISYNYNNIIVPLVSLVF